MGWRERPWCGGVVFLTELEWVTPERSIAQWWCGAGPLNARYGELLVRNLKGGHVVDRSAKSRA